MKYLFPILYVFLLMTSRCKEPTVGHTNGSIVQKSPAAEDEHHHKDTIVIIDTLIPTIGAVLVFYDPISDRLCLMSSLEKDTILGFTHWVHYLGDTIMPQPLSVEDIGLVQQERLTWHNIVCTSNKTMFFAINDQLRSTCVYAARMIDGKWLFLCEERGSCSVFYSSWGCKILDERRDRLLVKWPGVNSDVKNDKEFQCIGVYEYGSKGKTYIGELKLDDWKQEQCDTIAILAWYKAYEKIANKQRFNQYLVIPKGENKGGED